MKTKQLPKGWEEKPFEKCLEKVKYPLKIQKKDFLTKGEYPIISQEQKFINGYWNEKDNLFKVKKPVIIFGDHTQVIKYVDFDFVLGADGIKIIEPIEKINSKFLYYFLRNVKIKSLGYARHYRLLKEKFVPIPPLATQKQIVKILDEVFESISKSKENAEKNLENAKELFESYLEEVFSNPKEDWEEKKLGEVCEVIAGQSPE
ncbi:MAG: restriction endonuclease subunit S, partial [Patescibacteria group bacterium]